MAATKYRLDLNLARVLLKPFGGRPHRILLGLMCITGVFSMFMSNTATTAMMLSILAPVLATLPAGDRGRTAFTLAIPVAANIGGIGTPIGTPPNALALKYITEFYPISFGEWMLFGVPFVLVLMFIGWRLLCRFFPISAVTINLDIQGKFVKNWRAGVVYLTFTLTVLLWMFGGKLGLNAYVVALLPVAVFTCTGIISSKDLKTISWDVLWLIAGGIALGLALEQTGLAYRMVHSIPFSALAPFAVLVLAMLITFAMANFMSHTSTANLLLPVMAAMAAGIGGLAGFGGAVGLLLAVTFASSLGMTLPISTPPNALASATGLLTTKDMAKTGIVIGIIGLVLTVVMLLCIGLTGMI